MKFRFLSATKEGKLQFFERVIQFFLSHSYLLLGNCPAPWSTRARVAITRININTFRHFSRLVFSSFSLPRECACRHSPPSFVYKWHRLSASSANFSNRRVKGYTRCSRRWIRQITGKEPHRPLPFPFSFFCVLSSPPPLLLSPFPPPALFFLNYVLSPFLSHLATFHPYFPQQGWEENRGWISTKRVRPRFFARECPWRGSNTSGWHFVATKKSCLIDWSKFVWL